MAVSATTLPASPSSSPRLPSPPPIPEVQFGSQSPLLGPGGNENLLDVAAKPDEGAARRIRPGTKAVEMASGPPLVPLNQLDSPFQLQEHLKALYSNITQPPGSTTTAAVTQDTAHRLAEPPQINDGEAVDRNLWLYELCRFLTLKINIVIVALFADSPPCSSATCPEMRASEWQYLCAVHEPPKSCCAIDYCVHTLDWAANVLTSPKHFPSRLALGGDTGNVFQSMRQLTNIFRRVYRIFAHAWFQHREIFWAVEAQHGLYNFFKTVCDEYQLIPEDNYTIPPEAQKLPEDIDTIETADEGDVTAFPKILPRQSPPADNPNTTLEPLSMNTSNIGPTVRRHTRNNPSTGSHVEPIAEGQEDEDIAPTTAIEPPPQHYFNPLSPERTHKDLMNGRGRLNLMSTDAKDIFPPNDPTPTVEQPGSILGGPLDRLADREEDDDEDGGAVESNILAGDPDALRPVFEHMQKYEDTPADRSDTKTVVPVEEVGAPTPLKDDSSLAQSEETSDSAGDETVINAVEPEAQNAPALAPAPEPKSKANTESAPEATADQVEDRSQETQPVTSKKVEPETSKNEPAQHIRVIEPMVTESEISEDS